MYTYTHTHTHTHTPLRSLLLCGSPLYGYIKTTEFKTYGIPKRCHIIHGAKINQNDYDIKDDEIRIVAWLMTDGYVNDKKYGYYCISQSKEKYIQEIKDCLERLKVNYTCSVRKRNNKETIIKNKKVKKAKAENIFRLHAEFSKKIQIYLKDKNIFLLGCMSYRIAN